MSTPFEKLAHADDQLWLLVEAFCDGDATPAQREALNERLAAEPAARRFYLAYLQTHAELAWQRRGQINPSSESLELPAIPVVPPSKRSNVPTARSPVLGFLASVSRHVPGGEFTVGSLLLLVIVAAFWGLGRAILLPKPGGRDLIANPEPRDSKSETVATIRDTADAQWAEKSEIRNPKSEVATSEPLALSSGRVELQLKQGANLLIEGPARWTIDGNNSATLKRGRLVARVPRPAIGFTLDTPRGVIVDLGTEFGASVDPSGSTQVHIFRGEVQFDPAATGAQQDKPPSRRLTEGQSITVNEKGIESSSKDVTVDEFLTGRPKNAPGKNRTAVFQQEATHPFQAGKYHGCDDVQLLAWAAQENFGKRADFNVGNFDANRTSHALLRFDLSSLAGRFEKISRVTLRLNRAEFPEPPRFGGTLQLHALAAANADWISGTGVHSPVLVRNGRDWLQRKPGQNWQGAAGASKADVDYDSALLAEQPYEAAYNNRPLELVIRGDLQFLKNWIEQPEQNAGFFLRTARENEQNRINLHSSEATAIESRPALIVEYIPKERPAKELP